MLAMMYLNKNDFNMALKMLQRAQTLCESNDQAKAITYNNIACYYRKIGKLKLALSFLQNALQIEKRLAVPESAADTHLNICAVLSQLNKHDLALLHATSAVALLQELMLSGATLNPDRFAVLAIAYHNIGVEQEFLQRVSFFSGTRRTTPLWFRTERP
jgi:tetratricopeptide (TPR) repeat protein